MIRASKIDKKEVRHSGKMMLAVYIGTFIYIDTNHKELTPSFTIKAPKQSLGYDHSITGDERSTCLDLGLDLCQSRSVSFDERSFSSRISRPRHQSNSPSSQRNPEWSPTILFEEFGEDQMVPKRPLVYPKGFEEHEEKLWPRSICSTLQVNTCNLPLYRKISYAFEKDFTKRMEI